MTPQRVERGRHLATRHKSHKPAFVGKVERIESKDLARAVDILLDRYRPLVKRDAQPRSFSDFNQSGGQSPARQVAKAMDLQSCVEQRLDRLDDGCAVA